MEKQTALVKNEQTEIANIDEQILIKYLDAFGIAKSLTKEERMQFLQIAQMSNLNPWKKEIYCIKFGDKLSIVTGYEVYIKRAEKSGMLDGWECKTTGEIKQGTLKAICTIYRKDRKQPFVWEIDFSEYNRDRNLWKTKPKTMLKKVAVAQAFRLCFPNDFDSLPYIEDEMPGERIAENTPKEKETQEAESVQGFIDGIETKLDEDADAGWGKIDYKEKLLKFKENQDIINFKIESNKRLHNFSNYLFAIIDDCYLRPVDHQLLCSNLIALTNSTNNKEKMINYVLFARNHSAIETKINVTEKTSEDELKEFVRNINKRISETIIK